MGVGVFTRGASGISSIFDALYEVGFFFFWGFWFERRILLFVYRLFFLLYFYFSLLFFIPLSPLFSRSTFFGFREPLVFSSFVTLHIASYEYTCYSGDLPV